MDSAGLPKTRVGDDDRDYWLRRERAARDLAERAADDGVARIHRELADRYAARAAECASDGSNIVD